MRKDIHQKNILCELDDTVIERYLKSVPSKRELARIKFDSPIPSTPMRPPKDVRNVNIRLADFGQACHYPQRDGDRHQGQLLLMRAPEVILGLPWGTQVDMWNAGCLVSYISPTSSSSMVTSKLNHKDLGAF